MWGTIAGIAGQALGGLLNSAGGVASAGLQYKQQLGLQEAQQNWLEEMSNTAHQREINDLRQAGLNPLLTVMGGSGANTPSAGMGQIGQADLQSGISTAMQIRQQKNADAQTKAQIENMNAQTDTEATKQKLNIAEEQLKISENLLKREDLNSYQKRIAAELKESASRTVLNLGTATANQKNAESNRINANVATAREARENRLTAGEQANSLQELEEVKKHPIIKSIRRNLKGYKFK